MVELLVSLFSRQPGGQANASTAYKFPKAQERLEELKKGGSKAQMKRERLSRTNQKQQEENCVVM
jgi:hypothetical protein